MPMLQNQNQNRFLFCLHKVDRGDPYKDIIGRCRRGHQVTVIVTSYKKYNGCLQHGYINTSEMNHNHHRNKKRNNMATNDNYIQS